jgi:hypothetical protein
VASDLSENQSKNLLSTRKKIFPAAKKSFCAAPESFSIAGKSPTKRRKHFGSG